MLHIFQFYCVYFCTNQNLKFVESNFFHCYDFNTKNNETKSLNYCHTKNMSHDKDKKCTQWTHLYDELMIHWYWSNFKKNKLRPEFPASWNFDTPLNKTSKKSRCYSCFILGQVSKVVVNIEQSGHQLGPRCVKRFFDGRQNHKNIRQKRREIWTLFVSGKKSVLYFGLNYYVNVRDRIFRTAKN